MKNPFTNFNIDLNNLTCMFISLKSILEYRKKFTNWTKIIREIRTNSYPFKAITRDGQNFTIYGHSQIYFLLKGHNLPDYDQKDKILKINYKGHILEFVNALQNGGLFEVFIEEEYAPLNINGSNVIDIGGNIGDSAIYFALNGARSVISIEPQLSSFDSMVRNVALNSMDQQITTVRAGVGKSESYLAVSGSSATADGGMSLVPDKKGEEMHILDMKYISKNYLQELNVLKVDCEGCEYDFFDGADLNDLQKFQRIMVETHYGSKSIIKKLQKAGFEVTFSKGMIGYNTNSKPHIMSTRIVFAERKANPDHLSE